MKHATNQPALTGYWKSSYVYHNSYRDADLASEHYVQMHPSPDGNGLVIESVAGLNSSYLVLRVTINEDIATGTWQEETSPEGDYKGTIYYGAIQLKIAEDRKHINGEWVGFDRKMAIKNGPWEFTYLGEDVSAAEKDKKAN